MINRRSFLKTFSAVSMITLLPGMARGQNGAEFTHLKAAYGRRLKTILSLGELPYIDIESSCRSNQIDVDWLAKKMDTLHIGLMALSADIGEGQFKKGVRYDTLADKLVANYPDRFIPVGNGGQPPALTEAPDAFLDAQEAAAGNARIMLFGEFEFRHYPSPRQARRGEMDRDVNIPIDGATGHRVFSMSEKTGMPFQIHYEVEDELLAPLEKMLEQYPRARVIWCHLGQIRYIERASRYTPAYVHGLIKRFPNLYFDTAFGGPDSIYPTSNQRHARIWTREGTLKTEWVDLVVAYPQRFLSALDLGGDRFDRIADHDQNHRNFLQRLPGETRHQVAYRSAWSLLFGEEFS
jgi:predicted TIM-barrel fold metal-dependent hydrolase